VYAEYPVRSAELPKWQNYVSNLTLHRVDGFNINPGRPILQIVS